MSLFADGLEAAVQKAFTRPAPKKRGRADAVPGQAAQGSKPVAQMLRISQRTRERYVKDQIKKPRPDLAARLGREVKARWPQIRAKARQQAATTGGIVIDSRARLGCTAQFARCLSLRSAGWFGSALRRSTGPLPGCRCRRQWAGPGRGYHRRRCCSPTYHAIPALHLLGEDA
ncbi:telomere-protecting terminal protein Tpg [Streptomyces collinus]|uniref:telomere-protecting terminal protein Tpg n=1 Tax=Streptomyces collinus TaxID=42684 RepID=UPI0037A36B26